MNGAMGQSNRAPAWVAVAAALLIAVPSALAQRGGPAEAGPANADPPIDLTGYWVSVVTEGWRHRMVVPQKGDYESTAMTPAAVEIADAWDPAADEAAGEQCRWYGAGGVMRIPGRLHITWENEDTLRIDTDAGSQTRLFHFDPSAEPPIEQTLQGHSLAEWIGADGGREPGSVSSGRLRVVTDHLRMGYIRRNGVPYSDRTVMTEYYFTFDEPNGDRWLILTTFYDDPLYMTRRFMESTHFKQEADGSGWNPTECSAYR